MAALRQRRTPRLPPEAWRTLVLNSTCFILPIFIVIFFIFHLNYVRFSTADVVKTYTSNFSSTTRTTWLGIYGNLFSPGRSIFLYSPPVLLGLLGLRSFFRSCRVEAVLCATIALLYLATYSIWPGWAGGWCWGPRFLLPAIPFLMLPAAFFLRGRRTWLLGGVLLALGVAVQLLGIAIDYMQVHRHFLALGLDPRIMLFNWSYSAIPMHLTYVLHGHPLDLWSLGVLRHFGFPIFALTLVALLCPMILGTSLMLRVPRQAAVVR